VGLISVIFWNTNRNGRDALVLKIGRWDYETFAIFFFSPSKVIEASCIRHNSTNKRWFLLFLYLRSHSLARFIPSIKKACDAFLAWVKYRSLIVSPTSSKSMVEGVLQTSKSLKCEARPAM